MPKASQYPYPKKCLKHPNYPTHKSLKHPNPLTVLTVKGLSTFLVAFQLLSSNGVPFQQYRTETVAVSWDCPFKNDFSLSVYSLPISWNDSLHQFLEWVSLQSIPWQVSPQSTSRNSFLKINILTGFLLDQYPSRNSFLKNQIVTGFPFD